MPYLLSTNFYQARSSGKFTVMNIMHAGIQILQHILPLLQYSIRLPNSCSLSLIVGSEHTRQLDSCKVCACKTAILSNHIGIYTQWSWYCQHGHSSLHGHLSKVTDSWGYGYHCLLSDLGHPLLCHVFKSYCVWVVQRISWQNVGSGNTHETVHLSWQFIF